MSRIRKRNSTPWSVRIFSLFGIQLELHATFLLLLVWVAWVSWFKEGSGLAGTAWYLILVLLLFVCVVLHELGHCLVAKRFEVPVYRILLMPIGGMAQFGRIPRRPSRELLISGAGPLVNFVIVFALWIAIALFSDGFRQEFSYNIPNLVITLMYLNLVMGVFNLLPVFPMDGGRILRALLALKFSYLTATRSAVLIARPIIAVGIVLALWQLDAWLLAALLAFILVGGHLEYSSVKRQELFRGLTIGEIARPDFYVADSETTLGSASEQSLLHPTWPVVVFRGSKVFAVFRPEEIAQLAERASHDVKLALFAGRRPAVLFSDWPLELFVDQIDRSGQRIFPVITRDAVIGVVDTSTLESVARDAYRNRGKGIKR